MENIGKAQKRLKLGSCQRPEADQMSVSFPTGVSGDAMPNTTSCVWASPAEAPQPTKAAKKRARKAMKAALGEIVKGSDGIESIPLNGDSAKKAKEVDEAKARQNVIAAINSDAADVAREVEAYAALCGAEDEAKRERTVFADKMRNSTLRKKLQNVRDFFATKKAHEWLTGKDGTQYFTAKDWVLGECGVTYEYVRRLDARFSGYKNLLEDGTPKPPKALPQLTDGGSARGDDRASQSAQGDSPQESETVVADPQPKPPLAEEMPPLAVTVDEKVRWVVSYANRFVGSISGPLMTVDEKEEFYRQLSEKFRAEVEFPIDVTPVFGAPQAEATV
jgi:hypothetical protein